jgi:hypothetical protein
MVETVHTPTTRMGATAGDITMNVATHATPIDRSGAEASAAEGPSITGSCDFSFWR